MPGMSLFEKAKQPCRISVEQRLHGLPKDPDTLETLIRTADNELQELIETWDTKSSNKQPAGYSGIINNIEIVIQQLQSISETFLQYFTEQLMVWTERFKWYEDKTSGLCTLAGDISLEELRSCYKDIDNTVATKKERLNTPELAVYLNQEVINEYIKAKCHMQCLKAIISQLPQSPASLTI